MWSKLILNVATVLLVKYGNDVNAGNEFVITRGPLHNMVASYCTAVMDTTYFIPLRDEHLMIVDHYCNDLYECSYINKSTNTIKGRMYNCDEGGNGPNGWVYPRKFGMVVAPDKPTCVRKTKVWPEDHPCGTKSEPTAEDLRVMEELEMEQEEEPEVVEPAPLMGIAGPQCDLEKFSSPYVKVLHQRNGPYIETLEKSGFMDLTKYIHKLICINGPSIIYQDVRMDGPKNESRLFHDVEIETYSHQCMIINQISTAKAIQLRDAKIFNPTLYDVHISEVIGKMATGIYLVSEPSDYYLPTSVMLIRNDWEYIVTDDDMVRDASFVTVGAGPFCLSVNDKFDIVLSGGSLNDTSVCKWRMRESLEVTTKFRKRYAIIFNGTVSRHELSWRLCGGSGQGGSSGGNGLGPFPTDLLITTTPPPTSSQLDPFSIINPKFWSSKSRLKSSKRNGHPSHVIKLNDFEDDDTELTEDDLRADFLIELDPSQCIRLRPKLIAVDPSCNVNDVDKTGWELLNTVLTIEDPALKLPADLEWKEMIMDLVSEIFGKICEPFAATMPFTIARVVAYYLAKAHSVKPELLRTEGDVWKFLKSELNRCNDGIKKPMLWYWDNLEETLPMEIVDCKVENCSFGCFASHDGDKCEFKAGLNCATNLPVCDGNCVYDSTSKNCTDTTSPGNVCEPPYNCEDEDCLLDIETMACSDPFCTARSCFDPSNCIPDRASCKDRRIGGSTAGGAYPSTLDIDKLSLLLGSNGGSGGDAVVSALQQSFFKVVDTNEVFDFSTRRKYNFKGFPINILAITQILRKNATSRTITYDIDANTTLVGQCLFFYEDMAETDYELNIAIDIHWKIWSTVMGYCNLFYDLRKSETFPRLYNTYFEDIFQPIEENWKFPADNEYLKIILSDFNSEKSQKWLDTCLESSYHVSNSSTFRPPRPLTIGNDNSLQSNYFLTIPDFIRAQFYDIDLSIQNQTIQCP